MACNVGTGTQYGLTGVQQAVDTEFESYKEMTNDADTNHKATRTAIQQSDQVIQSQQIALQASKNQ